METQVLTVAVAEAPRQAVPREDINQITSEILASTPVLDIHTHLFAPQFGELGLSGVDNLLTYHYLEAELFRSSPIRPEDYWALDRPSRAELIWKTLFVENAPISEAARGAVAALSALGLDPGSPTLEPLREYFSDVDPDDHIDNIFRLAGVSSVVMTNDPLDPEELPAWNDSPEPDPRFQAALRLDRILNGWLDHHAAVAAQGYKVDASASAKTIAEIRRFVEKWCSRMKPAYMAVSLPDSFMFPTDDVRGKILKGAILPACLDLGLPLALMIGVRRQVNPALRLAGDAVGRADLRSLENLCREYPDNRFLVSVLSRENQHELCVYARKFANLMPFGCWWFLNNTSIVEEITRERLEMLGMSFIAQNSDARVLEQLVYKWRNTRRTIGPLIAQQFEVLAEDGRTVTRGEIQGAVTRLFRTNFEGVSKR
jgi:hypothetical protein